MQMLGQERRICLSKRFEDRRHQILQSVMAQDVMVKIVVAVVAQVVELLEEVLVAVHGVVPGAVVSDQLIDQDDPGSLGDPGRRFDCCCRVPEKYINLIKLRNCH